MNEVSGLIPKTFGQVMDVKQAYEEEEKFRAWCDDNEEAYKIALKLRNLVKNKGYMLQQSLFPTTLWKTLAQRS